MCYLLSGDGSAFRSVVSVSGKADAETCMHIYGNAYRVRLRETIETDHEILGLYLGDDLFEQMVNGYVTQYPSHYASLRDFTIRLPQFLEHQSPFGEHPILSEIARFERLLLDVFDAPDAIPATMDDLRALPTEQWPEMRIRFHPSVQLFTAAWNSVEAWNALKQGQAPDPASHQPASHWLLWRGTDRLSQFRSLPPDECVLLFAALHGSNFATLCEIMAEWHGDESAATVILGHLSDWLDNGIIATIAGSQPC